jgi:hypothetical protein
MMHGCRARLNLEVLEDRTLASATEALAGGVLSIVADDSRNFLVASTPRVGVTEIFDAVNNVTRDFSGVTALKFQAGRGDTDFYQTTVVPSTLTAGSGPSTYTLVAVTGQNVLTAGTSPASTSYLQAGGNGQTFLANGGGTVNIFGGGSDTITVSGVKTVQLYDIVGTSKISLSAKTGYALVNAQSQVTVSPSITQVVFFQPALQGPQKIAARIVPDVNNNNILYLTPLNPTANVDYQVSLVSGGKTIAVEYSDSLGAIQTVYLSAANVQWVAFFSVSGVSQVTNNTNISDVFYGKSGSVLRGGGGAVDVLKIHSGAGIAVGRAQFEDLFAGPAGVTTGATLLANGNQAVYRNATDRITTRDLGVDDGDVVIGVPAQIDGQFSADAGQPAMNADFSWLALLLSDKRRDY